MAKVAYPTHEMLIRELASDSYWQVKIMTYDVSNNLSYLACNRNHLAATSAASWYIWKYTWNGSGNCTQIEGPLIGTVTGQSSLSWRP